MRAWVHERYGPPEVLELREVPKPAPGPGEILVRTCATTVSSGDHRARSLDLPAGFGPVGRLMFGVRRPRQPILGTELSGWVEAVGEGVTRFRPGDAVFAFGDTGMRCHAEYRCFRQDGLVAGKPPNLTFEQAAALAFGGTTALHALRTARLQRGEQVLVNGASGAVGTACVQLARNLGADVTGVCSAANVELVRSLGASHVVDYGREDFTSGGRRYDVIVDTVGTAPFARSKAALAARGRLVLVLASLADLLRSPWWSLTSGHRVTAPIALGRREDLERLAELAAAGAFTPVIDRCYPFEQLIEAHRRVDTGHKRGSVVVTMGPVPAPTGA
jgi:NADPH:quinone reductase-like Zn-dependent oxidoreductase